MSFIRAAAPTLRRGLATAATSASTAPPIQLHGLSGKYAGALFTAALKKSAATLTQVEKDLTGVAATIKAEPSVRDFLSNPVLSAEARSSGIDALISKSSKSSSEITKNLFEVLAANGRLYEAEKVISDFLDITAAHRGEVKVTVTTAQPLEKDLMKRVEEALKSSGLAKDAKNLIVENKVNEAILGGLVLDFADKTVDLSVASKVTAMNAALQEPI